MIYIWFITGENWLLRLSLSEETADEWTRSHWCRSSRLLHQNRHQVSDPVLYCCRILPSSLIQQAQTADTHASHTHTHTSTCIHGHLHTHTHTQTHTHTHVHTHTHTHTHTCRTHACTHTHTHTHTHKHMHTMIILILKYLLNTNL